MHESAHPRNEPAHQATTRQKALLTLLKIYVAIQLISVIVFYMNCYRPSVPRIWLYGALGPFAIFEALPRFRMNAILPNLALVVVCLAVLALPLLYIRNPRRSTLILSTLGFVVWWALGLGFSINHI